MKLKFSLQTISRSEAQRESTREEGEEAQITPLTSPANPELQFDDRTHQILPIAPHRSYRALRKPQHCAARSCLSSISSPRDLTFDPLISLCDFDFCCCCGGVVVVFWWLCLLIAGVCCRGLNWSFGGVWCWDLAMICSVDWDLAVILKFYVIKFVWMLRK